jgi:hypothetical protein
MMVLHTQPKLKLEKPKSELRHPFFYIAENGFFQGFIMFCIFFNSVILALEWYGQSESMVTIIEQLNYTFTAIFTMELVVHLLAFGN